MCQEEQKDQKGHEGPSSKGVLRQHAIVDELPKDSPRIWPGCGRGSEERGARNEEPSPGPGLHLRA